MGMGKQKNDRVLLGKGVGQEAGLLGLRSKLTGYQRSQIPYILRLMAHQHCGRKKIREMASQMDLL